MADDATPIDRKNRVWETSRVSVRLRDDLAPAQRTFEALTDLGAALEQCLRRFVLLAK